MANTLEEMIEYDLRGRGITDERVLAAFRRADRKLFVPPMEQARAYDDRPLCLSHGQTVSQPYMVAVMTQALALQGTERVLEIGTGSGYQTAVLACLAAEVYTVERIEYLATTAEDRLLALGFRNIHFRLSDGSLGWPEHAPYSRVVVTAACPRVPQPLADQLEEGGILVAPVGPTATQTLTIATRKGGQLHTQSGIACVFVKLIGAEGYASEFGDYQVGNPGGDSDGGSRR
ncbi:MAG: protein-L-isoaspartate(D-aspartate) O-methyltransferase [Planctomycetota bacterium]|nr:protein-L-isoaspartate(D-aspartate) O-methyltransferase [Planctomycetota bacterium]